MSHPRDDEIACGVAVIAAVTDRDWTRDDALAWAGRLWRLDPARLDRHVITGSPDGCAAQLQRYRAVGAQHVTVLLATDEPVEMFRALATSYPAD